MQFASFGDIVFEVAHNGTGVKILTFDGLNGRTSAQWGSHGSLFGTERIEKTGMSAREGSLTIKARVEAGVDPEELHQKLLDWLKKGDAYAFICGESCWDDTVYVLTDFSIEKKRIDSHGTLKDADFQLSIKEYAL